MEIGIGMHVRSFDFDSHDLSGPRACYVEGVVESIVRADEVNGFDCDRYKIAVNRAVFGGVEREKMPTHVYPPLNGTPTLFGDETNNVEIIRLNV